MALGSKIMNFIRIGSLYYTYKVGGICQIAIMYKISNIFFTNISAEIVYSAEP